jgi:hypothetical protein
MDSQSSAAWASTDNAGDVGIGPGGIKEKSIKGPEREFSAAIWIIPPGSFGRDYGLHQRCCASAGSNSFGEIGPRSPAMPSGRR